MRILALETSCREASVAALDGDRLLGQLEFGSEQRTAQVFASVIDRQLKAVGWAPSDVQLIVVSQGPGSFTGLRVGVTATKTLAYATGAQILGINTQQVIAQQTEGDWHEVTVVGDAQRQQLFVTCFRRSGDRVTAAAPSRIVDVASWLESLEADQWVTGPGLARLIDRLPARVWATPADHWVPRAATLGRLGYADYLDGRRDDLWKLAPVYYRQSAAEEKLAQAGPDG
jgi:tRNA threonylcarbamoyladenosine biosynthesis protein TsaB